MRWGASVPRVTYKNTDTMIVHGGRECFYGTDAEILKKTRTNKEPTAVNYGNDGNGEG